MLIETDKRLALQAYEQILNLILSGQASPGAMITERRIAETLSMSRTPIRDALLMLEGEGLLIRQGSRGLQVKQMRIEDYMDALQIRQLLEPEAARLAAGRMPPDLLDRLTQDLNSLIEFARSGDRKPERSLVRGVDDQLHDGIGDAAGNPQLAQIIRTLRRQTQIFDLRSVPERQEATCREHLAIVEALRTGRSDEAAELMRQHIDNVRESIIRRLTRA
ncbi:GntR family transcriptional regulator [Rhizobium sp. SSA_523]|uniref:GntR family transcriptional regulator n=1 Tax=Rhizobium sp. SSA_523 TaxID=2952477 RepID=UPI002091A3A0|nr:GntR family transcriptional regulator [Rhizobium sp. SSA_523]MCO5731185.1 GntR family transcriptional regulator [Rhizobium sp. SSA_523]WKC22272.1 GntR family transcriptional regulator [Rhizobium sp. SSA_523]